MEIRKAVWNDVPEIWKLGKGVDEFMVAENTVDFRPKEILKNIIEDEYSFILGAWEEESPLGFVVINYNPVFGKAIIENLLVRKSSRGKGIGKKITGLERLKGNNLSL